MCIYGRVEGTSLLRLQSLSLQKTLYSAELPNAEARKKSRIYGDFYKIMCLLNAVVS